MKQLLMVGHSNAINRYGERFTVGALTRGVHDTCLDGVPFLVAHDASRQIGWAWPLAVHLAPGLSRSVSLVGIAEGVDEQEQNVKRFNHHLYMTGIKESESEIKDLRNKLSAHLHGDEKVVVAECLALIGEGLASRAFPDLFSKQDKDGLIAVEELNPIGPGVYRIGEFAVFAHLFFRRNLYPLNSLNYPVLEQLHGLDASKTTARIAIDPDMVGLASTYNGGRVELAYWWGPQFNNDLATIPVGVTTHEEDDKAMRAFTGISRTEFRWGSRKGEHILEAEELRDTPSALADNKYGCRFVHSIVKEATGEIVHFDGSIRLYSEEEMIERLELDLSRAERNTEYKKLWRCDGVIETALWKRLLSDYYRDNYLVGEYLGARNPFKEEEPEVLESSPKDQFVPYSMAAGEGLRVAISYRATSNNDKPTSNRYVIPMDRISDGHETNWYIEPYGIELQKALLRMKTSLHIPNNVLIVTFKDLYANFPLVYHSHEDLANELVKTLQAVKLLVDRWQSRGLDMVLSFKVAFPIGEDHDVFLSFLGHVNDLASWFTHPLSLPPITLEELHVWGEEVSEYLGSQYPAKLFDTPPLLQTLMTSGVLLIDRQPIPREWKVDYSLRPEGLAYQLQIPSEDRHLLKIIQVVGVQPAIAFQVLESRCTRCNQAYPDCECSKVLDDDVAQEITNARLAQMFWTDRSPY